MEIGEGYCLYFLFLRFCLILLGVIAIFFAIPSLLTYWSSNSCPIDSCSFFVRISIGNDKLEVENEFFLEVLSLIGIILLIVLHRYGYFYLKRKSIKYDEEALTISGSSKHLMRRLNTEESQF